MHINLTLFSEKRQGPFIRVKEFIRINMVQENSSTENSGFGLANIC